MKEMLLRKSLISTRERESHSTCPDCCSRSSCWSQAPFPTSLSLSCSTLQTLPPSLPSSLSDALFKSRLHFSELFGVLFLIFLSTLLGGREEEREERGERESEIRERERGSRHMHSVGAGGDSCPLTHQEFVTSGGAGLHCDLKAEEEAVRLIV